MLNSLASMFLAFFGINSVNAIILGLWVDIMASSSFRVFISESTFEYIQENVRLLSRNSVVLHVSFFYCFFHFPFRGQLSFEADGLSSETSTTFLFRVTHRPLFDFLFPLSSSRRIFSSSLSFCVRSLFT